MGKKYISQKVMEHRKEKRKKAKPGLNGAVNNPFEIRVNRSKANVLGRKVKEEKGRPGISRSKAIKKKRTLLQEYKVKDKANVFLDKRFGEFDEQMPIEEKMLKRFALSRQQHHKKAGTYNLDDEDLTHLGQSLAEIDDYNDEKMFDESEEEMGDEALTHFGDFSGNLGSIKEGNKPKTRKQIVDEIIAQSKKTKFERQQVHEETVTQTENLDSQYRSILGLLEKKGDSSHNPAPAANEYDILVNKLKFESRAKASDRIKSKEEEEEERKKALKIHEEERAKRMKMPSQNERKVESVDSLVEFSGRKVDKRFEMRFKDGKMIMPEGVSSLIGEKGTHDDTVDSDGMSGDEEEAKPPFKIPENELGHIDVFGKRTHEEQVKYLSNLAKQLTDYTGIDKKAKAQGLFDAVFDHIDSLCDSGTIPFGFVNKMSGPIFDLAMIDPSHAHSCIQTKLRKCIKRFWRKSQMSDNKVLLPSAKEIMLLKFIATIYPTSDVKHIITTPALTLMAAILSKSSFKTPKNIAVGLLLSTMILEYVSLSKRYVPEVIRFLTGVLWLSVKREDTDTATLLKFRKGEQEMLVLESKQESVEPCLGKVIFSNEDVKPTALRLDCIQTCLKLLCRFSQLYDALPSHDDIFQQSRDYLKRLNISMFPEDVKNLVTSTAEELAKTCNMERVPLQWLARKPVPLPLLEPRFMETYEVRNDKRGGMGKSNEKQKLRYKFKKEFKGAVREVRKDAQFLAKEQLRETIERDKDRARKVKELMSDLGQQQGECKALDKIKKKASR